MIHKRFLRKGFPFSAFLFPNNIDFAYTLIQIKVYHFITANSTDFTKFIQKGVE